MKHLLEMNNYTKSTILCRQSGQFQCNLHLDSSNWQNDSIKKEIFCEGKWMCKSSDTNKQINTQTERNRQQNVLLMLLLFKPMKMVTCLYVHYWYICWLCVHVFQSVKERWSVMNTKDTCIFSFMNYNETAIDDIDDGNLFFCHFCFICDDRCEVNKQYINRVDGSVFIFYVGTIKFHRLCKVMNYF